MCRVTLTNCSLAALNIFRLVGYQEEPQSDHNHNLECENSEKIHVA